MSLKGIRDHLKVFQGRCLGYVPARTSPQITLQLGVKQYCCQLVLLLLSDQQQQQQQEQQQQDATRSCTA